MSFDELRDSLEVLQNCERLRQDSRSSVLSNTAAGVPFRVTTTRSWCSCTRSMNSGNLSRTVRLGSLLMEDDCAAPPRRREARIADHLPSDPK